MGDLLDLASLEDRNKRADRRDARRMRAMRFNTGERLLEIRGGAGLRRRAIALSAMRNGDLRFPRFPYEPKQARKRGTTTVRKIKRARGIRRLAEHDCHRFHVSEGDVRCGRVGSVNGKTRWAMSAVGGPVADSPPMGGGYL